MNPLTIIWGGTQLTTTRITLAIIAELLIILYLILAMRLFGR